jgi:hypothetical protein
MAVSVCGSCRGSPAETNVTGCSRFGSIPSRALVQTPCGQSSARARTGPAASQCPGSHRFGLRPWPWAVQAEQHTIKQAVALLPDGEYTAQVAVGHSQTVEDALTAALPIWQGRQSAATR